MLCLAHLESRQNEDGLVGFAIFRIAMEAWVVKETDHDNSACRRSDVAPLSCRAEWIFPAPVLITGSTEAVLIDGGFTLSDGVRSRKQ